MKEVLDIISSIAEAHLKDWVEQCGFVEDAISGEFPAVTPYKEQFYKSICVYTLLADGFIFYIDTLEEISADDYLDLYNEVNQQDSFNPQDN